MKRVLAGLAIAILLTGCGSGGQPVTTPPTTTHAGHSASPPPPAAPLRSGEHFLQLTLARPYTPAAPNGGFDEYRCFLLDPGLTSAAYVTGSQFLPDNGTIVHHAIVYRVEPDAAAEAQRLDADTPGDGWTCFGGTGVGAASSAARQLTGDAGWIAAWAPGGGESLAPARTGYRMTAGSQVILQVHYSLLGTGGQAGPDRSALRLRVTAGGANFKPLITSLAPAPVELPCAPDEKGPLCDRTAAIQDVGKRFGRPAKTMVFGLNLLCNGGKDPVPGPKQHCDIPVRQAGTVYAVAGHMHLLGRSIRVELNPGKPGARVLLDVPDYDFDNQGARTLAKPVTVKRGDTYRVTCTHDAGLRRQLPALQPLDPRYVVWGDGTSDEMCLAIIIWTP